MLFSASWNIQGKSIKDIENAWSELGLAGFDFFGFQELGGQSDLSQPWDTLEANLDGVWSLYASNPPLAFRAVAVGLHNRHTPFVEKVTPLSCGIAVTLKKDSCRTFIVSAHLGVFLKTRGFRHSDVTVPPRFSTFCMPTILFYSPLLISRHTGCSRMS